MPIEGLCVAHYAKDKDKDVTKDAITSKLGTTLWQKQDDKNTRLLEFGIGYLEETKTNYSIG